MSIIHCNTTVVSSLQAFKKLFYLSLRSMNTKWKNTPTVDSNALPF